MNKIGNRFIIVIIMVMTIIGFNSFYSKSILANTGLTVNNPGLTLTGNQTVVGNLQVQGGTLNLAGYTLTITGNIIQSSGTMDINGGKLIVGGNYSLDNPDSGGGFLIMLEDNDYIRVGGNFTTHTPYEHSDNLTAGILEIKGDFTQRLKSGSRTSSFNASGSHKVILSGSDLQTVSFDKPGVQWGESRFNILEITNSSSAGVEFANTTFVVTELKATNTPITGSEKLHFSNNAIISGGKWNSDLSISGTWTLQQDQEIGGNLYGGSINLNNHALTVGQSVQSSADLDLNGGTFTIGQDLVQTNGTIDINSGKLIVGGNFTLDNNPNHSGGTLRMVNSTDYIRVEGNFTTHTPYEHSEHLIAGTLEVKGDFTQRAYSGSVASNFNVSGSHKVVLSGSELQTVSFDKPGAKWGDSRFNMLEITNPSSEGVNLATKTVVIKEVKAANVNVSGTNNLRLAGAAVVTKGNWPHDAYVDENWTLSQDVTLDKKLYLTGGTLDFSGHQLTIPDNFIHSAGTLYVNTGKLNVGKDYRIQQENTDTYTSSNGYLKMVNDTDTIMINGSFVMDSTKSHGEYLSNGVLEVKGDFTQKSSSQTNFLASGTHKVVMSGPSLQIIEFSNPSKYESCFNILEINNASTQGININTKITINKLFEHHQKVVVFALPSDIPDYDQDGIRDDKDPFPSVYDTTPPKVMSSDPVNWGDRVLVDKTISLMFSKDIKQGESFDGIVLQNSAGNLVNTVVTFSENVLTVKPGESLFYLTDHVLTIPTGALRDLSKESMTLTSNYTLNFKTEPDIYPPFLTANFPVNGKKHVRENSTLTVTFNEAMKLGPDQDRIVLSDPSGNSVSILSSISDKVLSIMPSANLGFLTSYTLTVPKTAVQDTAGNAPTTDISFGFTTKMEGELWDSDQALGNNDSNQYQFAGIHTYDNLTIDDDVTITSTGISQLVIKVKGTLSLGKNATIRVRNGYYPNAPEHPVSNLSQQNINTEGINADGFRLYEKTYGRGGNGENGETGKVANSYGGWGGSGGGGGGGGFGGGLGGSGGKYGNGLGGMDGKNGAKGQDNGGDGGHGGGASLSLSGIGGLATEIGRNARQSDSNLGQGGSGGGGNGGSAVNGQNGTYFSNGAGGEGGGGGGYGGGILSIIADNITYDNNAAPKFVVSGQLGNSGAQKGEGGLLIIQSNNYVPSLNQWNLTSTLQPPTLSNNGGHGRVTGNPQRVFVNGIDCTTEVIGATLQSIAIASPATKLSYTVGDDLDITGLEVTGTYSDGSTKTESITAEANIIGFNSAIAATDQVLTITVNGKTVTYIVQIVGGTNYNATPLVQIGINHNYGDSAGIFIGLKEIKDSQGHLIPDAKLARYQIDFNYDHYQSKVLFVYDEAHLGNFRFSDGVNPDKISVEDEVDHGVSNFEKLLFVPLALTGSSKNPTEVTIKFTNLCDINRKDIFVPDLTLTFQRGKIASEASQKSLGIVDAVAGLQYLAKLVDAGEGQGKVNVINMASILPPAQGTKTIMPSVKDVVALLQYLADLRNDSFLPLN